METDQVKKDEFAFLYYSNTNKYVAAHYGVTPATISNWVKRFGLKKKRRNFKLRSE